MVGKEDYQPQWIPERIIVKGREREGEREREAMYGKRR
jgi:hypothetical protein